eukprot:752855-Hanusia_phi.AAC.2
MSRLDERPHAGQQDEAREQRTVRRNDLSARQVTQVVNSCQPTKPSRTFHTELVAVDQEDPGANKKLGTTPVVRISLEQSYGI